LLSVQRNHHPPGVAEEFKRLCKMNDDEVGEEMKAAKRAKMSEKAKPNSDNPKTLPGFLNLKAALNQKNFVKFLVEYFIKEMIPLRRIESPYFRLFVKRLVGKANWQKGKLRFIRRRTLRRKIKKKFDDAVRDLKASTE
jgi:hypothetical protein